jgi:hypothetical protein
MTPIDKRNVACAALLALLGACTTTTFPIPKAACEGLGQGCGEGSPCCPGFICDKGTQQCLLVDTDGSACQAVLGDCTQNPDWCCAGSYCDPVLTSCQSAVTASGAACSVQGAECTIAPFGEPTIDCCTDLTCDANPDSGVGVCVNSYQAPGGPCTAAIQCAPTPAADSGVTCDPILLADAGAADCCNVAGFACTPDAPLCCTGAYCDPVASVCAPESFSDGGACSAPADDCTEDGDCCADLECDTDAGVCFVPPPPACLANGANCAASPTDCCAGSYCDPVSNLCAVAASTSGGPCFTPGTTCILDGDCCPDLVCDSDAGVCTGCATSTQGCGVLSSGDGGVDGGADAGVTDGGMADAGDGG